tara:strand:- start:8176 stop:8361 length:186 start_codon:yes stop_codon:yes gene_type:complete
VQEILNEVVNLQVELIKADLQLLRDESVVSESERDPGFRERVRAELDLVAERMGHLVQNVV